MAWSKERRAQGGAEGEKLSPTQPFPTHVPPLMPQQFSLDDEFKFPPLIGGSSCHALLSSARNDGLYTPPSTQGTLEFPMTGGGVNWGSAAFDPVHQILYANTTYAIHLIKLMPAAEAEGYDPPPGHDFGRQRGAPFAMTRVVALSKLGLLCNKPPWGMMVALDLKAGKVLWRSTVGTSEDLAPLGIAFPLGHAAVQRRRHHRGRSRLHRRARRLSPAPSMPNSGEELWQGRLPVPGVANPMTYVWNGEQYVVIAAGGSSEAGTSIGDSLVGVSLALARAGEAPSLWSRTIDRPGGRFTTRAVGALLVVVLMAIGAWRWRRRSRLRSAST